MRSGGAAAGGTGYELSLIHILDLFDELRCYEVSPEALYKTAQKLAARDKLTDLSLIYGAYEMRLYRPGFDARDRMSKLCDQLESSGYAKGKDLYLDGFTYFTAQERRVIEILMRQARSVTVTLLGAVSYTHLDVYKRQVRNLMVRSATG